MAEIAIEARQDGSLIEMRQDDQIPGGAVLRRWPTFLRATTQRVRARGAWRGTCASTSALERYPSSVARRLAFADLSWRSFGKACERR